MAINRGQRGLIFPGAGKEVGDGSDKLRRTINWGAVVSAVSSIRKRLRLGVSRSGRATRGVVDIEIRRNGDVVDAMTFGSNGMDGSTVQRFR